MQEKFRRRRLPHFDNPGAIYFVTTCLENSIPASGLSAISDYRARLRKVKSENYWKLVFAHADQWLDLALGVKHLANARLAGVVEDAILHFAGQRYSIWAWVVMSNHIHVVFEPCPEWVTSLGESANQRTPRERIVHSLKRFSSRKCNSILGTHGKFWQEESYDHCVTESDELQRIIEYIEMNPVKASMCEKPELFRFSSAHYRSVNKVPSGRPLIGQTQMSSFD